MAHKKAGGSVNSGRKANAKRLGVKLFGGQTAKAGNILIRQKGSKWESGKGTSIGRDFTIYATQDGVVSFTQKRKLRFNGQTPRKTYIHVIPLEQHKSTAKEKSPAKKKEVVTAE
jgi:large subunit ribosomal protein L27